MTRKRRPQGDLIEQRMELVLSPERACFSFVSDLDEVAAKITKLIGSDPARAAILYETFLAACYVKIEELDDSSGSFDQFVEQLYCGWIKARQADGADPDETASRLLTWMDQDDYGFCYRLEMDMVKVFNKASLAAFVNLVRARFDAAAHPLMAWGSTFGLQCSGGFDVTPGKLVGHRRPSRGITGGIDSDAASQQGSWTVAT